MSRSEDEARELYEDAAKVLQDGEPAKALIALNLAWSLLEGPALRGKSEHDDIRARLQMNRGAALGGLGDRTNALEAYDLSLALFNSGTLQERKEYNAERARLQIRRGVVLRRLGNPSEALAAYNIADTLLEGAMLQGRSEYDGDRADLLKNRGVALANLGDPAGALASYEAGLAFLDSAALNGHNNHDIVRVRLQINQAAALRKLGYPTEALDIYDAAVILLEGPVLRGRPEYDADRSWLQINRGLALRELGDANRALMAYEAASALLSGPELRKISKYNHSRAWLQTNRGDALCLLKDFSGAMSAFNTAQCLYEEGTIGNWPPLNAHRFRLYALKSEILFYISHPHTWAQSTSTKMSEMLELAPRSVNEVAWRKMRRHFAAMHSNWLRFALERSDLEVVPEILAAVQGREAAADVLDRLGEDGAAGSGEDDVLSELRRVRLELRRMAEEVRDGGGAGGFDGSGGSGGMRGGSGLRGMEGFGGPGGGGGPSPEALARMEAARAETAAEREREAQAAYRALYDRFTELRRKAERLPGYELLGAPHRALTAEALRGCLDEDEALLLVFGEPDRTQFEGAGLGDPGARVAAAGKVGKADATPGARVDPSAPAHAVLLRAGAPAVHVTAPALSKAAGRLAAYAAGQENRSGMRRGGYMDARDAAGPASPAPSDARGDTGMAAPSGAGFWSELAALQSEGLWSDLAPHLEGVRRVVTITHGPLHQLALTAGAPEGLEVARYPGLVFFALKRGLYDRMHENGADEDSDGTGDARGLGAGTRTAARSHRSASSAPASLPSRLGIITHPGVENDIPLAPLEGAAAAALWRAMGTGGASPVVELPAAWPWGGERLGLLHVASHGDLLPRGAPDARSVILLGTDGTGRRLDVDEMVVGRAPPVDVAFLNICLGGRSVDDPFDGSPSGLVSGLMRMGARAVIAALPPVPDRWAFVLGLLFTHELACELAAGAPRPVAAALRRAKERLAQGDWPEPVREAIRAQALASILEDGPGGPGNILKGSENFATTARDRLADTGVWWWKHGTAGPNGAADDVALLERHLDGLAFGAPERLAAIAEAAAERLATPAVPSPDDLGLITHGVVLFGEE